MTDPTLTIRKGSTPKERQEFFERQRQRAAAIEKQKELWQAINSFVSKNGGWLTSTPGERPLRVEMPAHSELADQLCDAGYDLHPAGTGERIIADRITPVVCYTFTIPTPR